MNFKNIYNNKNNNIKFENCKNNKNILYFIIFLTTFFFLLIFGVISFSEEDKSDLNNMAKINRGTIFKPFEKIIVKREKFSNYIGNQKEDFLAYVIKDNNYNENNKKFVEIPLLKTINGKYIFSFEESFLKENGDRIYSINNSKSKKNLNLPYNSIGDIREVNGIISKENFNIKNIDDNNKNKIYWLLDNFYPSKENPNEKKYLKNYIFKNIFEDKSVEAENYITDGDMYAIVQALIWNILNNKDYNIKEMIGVSSNEFSFGKYNIGGTKRSEIREKVYLYLRDEVQKKGNLDYSYVFPKLTLKEDELNSNSYNISIQLNHIVTASLKEFNLYYLNENGERKIIDPKLYTLTSKNGEKNTLTNSEYIKKCVKENEYKNTDFIIQVDKSFLEKNKINQKNINTSIVFSNLSIITNIYENEENMQSVIMLSENKDMFSLNTYIKENMADISVKVGTYKIGGTKITGRTIEKDNISFDNTKTEFNYYGKSLDPEIDVYKKNIEVNTGDKVTSEVSIINEGNKSGKCKKIFAYIPKEMEFIKDSEINKKYEWTPVIEDEKGSVYESKKYENENINSFLYENNRVKVDIRNLFIETKVKANISVGKTFNIFAFTSYDQLDFNENILDRDIGKKVKIDEKEVNKYFFSLSSMTNERIADELISSFGKMDLIDSSSFIFNEKGDLSLFSVVNKINEKEVNKIDDVLSYKKIDVTNLNNKNNLQGKELNAVYPKIDNREEIKVGDSIKIVITIFNEKEADNVIKKLGGIIPKGFELDKENEINKENFWKEENGFVYTEKTIPIGGAKLVSGEHILPKVEIPIILKVNKYLKENSTISFGIIEAEKVDRDSEYSKESLIKYAENENSDFKKDKQDEKSKLVFINKKEKDFALKMGILKIGERDIEGRIPNDNMLSKKNAIECNKKERVVFGIKLFNEGEKKERGKKVRVYVPKSMDFLDYERSNINKKYNWKIIDDKKRIIETDIFLRSDIKENESNLISLELLTSENIQPNKKECIIAEISDTSYVDKDSVSSSLELDKVHLNEEEFFNKILEKYKNDNLEIPRNYIINEDDEDFETIIFREKELDLALTTYVSKINGKELAENRKITADTTPLKNNEKDAKYIVDKTPILIKKGDEIEIKFRVYNEAQEKTVASKIGVYIPEGFAYILEDNINIENCWEVKGAKNFENVNGKNIVKGKIYLSRKEQPDSEKDYIEEFNINSGEIHFKEYNLKLISLVGQNRDSNELGLSEIKGKKVFLNTSNNSNITENNVSSENREENNLNNINVPNQNLSTNNVKNIFEIISEIKEIKSISNKIDRDSTPDNLNPNNYKKGGEEDDDSFLMFAIEEYKVDLSLAFNLNKIKGINEKRNFSINRENVLPEKFENKFIYNEKEKQSVEVSYGDELSFTVTIYNEGDFNAFCSKLAVLIPDSLELSEKEKNWKYADSNYKEVSKREDATFVITDSLSYEKIKNMGKKLSSIPAYNRNNNKIYYHEITLNLKVRENVNLNNAEEKIYAEIVEIEDEWGGKTTDFDSKLGNLAKKILKKNNDKTDNLEKTNENNNLVKNKVFYKQNGLEDDEDFEKITFVNTDLKLDTNLINFEIIEKNKKNETVFKEVKYNRKAKNLKNNKNKKLRYARLQEKQLKPDNQIKLKYMLLITNRSKVGANINNIRVHIPNGFSLSSLDTNSLWKNVSENEIVLNSANFKTLNENEQMEIPIEVIAKGNSNISNDLNLLANIEDIVFDKEITQKDKSDLVKEENLRLVVEDINIYVFIGATILISFINIYVIYLIIKIKKYNKINNILY